ncbi:MAG: glycoside hydrolase family 88 protein [Bacteroidota bacterium]
MLLFLGFSNLLPQPALDSGTWPKGCSPEEIGKRVADHFAASPLGGYNRTTPLKSLHYAEVCTWYGALTFARVTNDTALRSYLVARFQPLFEERKGVVPIPDHVDNTVFAAVPFEILIQTRDKRFLDLGKDMADKQWGEPFGPNANDESLLYYNRGYTWQTRLWIDDMFMITAAQAQAFRATGDTGYIDRAAREMVMYLDSLQKPNGLFYHAPDVPFYWGRGNGWMAAGMAELLRSLPQQNPYRPRIMQGYKTMMASLLKYQGEDGMWHQLIDHPESWVETSCTGMFTFALITGVRNGWLDETTYGPSARKGWLGLIKFIDGNADIHEVCEGTGKKNDLQYYLDRKRNIGDMHGQAPVLWCASALLR